MNMSAREKPSSRGGEDQAKIRLCAMDVAREEEQQNHKDQSQRFNQQSIARNPLGTGETGEDTAHPKSQNDER